MSDGKTKISQLPTATASDVSTTDYFHVIISNGAGGYSGKKISSAELAIVMASGGASASIILSASHAQFSDYSNFAAETGVAYYSDLANSASFAIVSATASFVDWSNIRNVPSASLLSGTVDWSAITNLPTVFPASWATVSGKPVTFTPSTHTHPWSQITSTPTVFPPTYHTHSIVDISGFNSGSFATASYAVRSLLADSSSVAAYSFYAISAGTSVSASKVPWTGVMNKPSTFPPGGHFHYGYDILSIVPSSSYAVNASHANTASFSDRTRLVPTGSTGIVSKGYLDSISGSFGSGGGISGSYWTYLAVPPASTSTTGSRGQCSLDADHAYFYFSDWKRVTLSTF